MRRKASFYREYLCGVITFLISIALSILLLLCATNVHAQDNLCARQPIYVSHIYKYFPDQLEPPSDNNRKSMAQFGYNLFMFTFPLFPIADFIPPGNFGEHSYHKALNFKEKNGALYTCKGGFIDFTHLRTGADWTVHLAFKIIADYNDFELPPGGGSLELHFRHLDDLTLEDLASLAQKIAFERLLWHETASWYYHRPNYFVSEQRSSFTPEDLYSDLLGSMIGRNIVLRILNDREVLPYSTIVSEEIEKVISSLDPVATKKESRRAYDIIDRNKQLKLSADARNQDVWYDSKIVFRDQRYVFKRNITTGPEIEPWLIPQSEQVGCSSAPEARTVSVPQTTGNGVSFYQYYEFKISPDSSLFYDEQSGEQLHPPFAPFTTEDFNGIIQHVKSDMEQALLNGFDERNGFDPVPHFDNVKKVLFK